MNLHCTFRAALDYDPAELTMFDDRAVPPPVVGVLTDEHARCSYGLPTITVGGVPHGPGDLPPGAVVHVSPQYTEDAPADIPTWWPREREAAYVTPESADLIRRAVAAGYPIDPRVRLLTESPP